MNVAAFYPQVAPVSLRQCGALPVPGARAIKVGPRRSMISCWPLIIKQYPTRDPAPMERRRSAGGCLNAAARQMLLPCSRHHPKILRIDDTEIVGDRIAEFGPVAGHFFAHPGRVARRQLRHRPVRAASAREMASCVILPHAREASRDLTDAARRTSSIGPAADAAPWRVRATTARCSRSYAIALPPCLTWGRAMSAPIRPSLMMPACIVRPYPSLSWLGSRGLASILAGRRSKRDARARKRVATGRLLQPQVSLIVLPRSAMRRPPCLAR
jgi:hypothetical protein